MREMMRMRRIPWAGLVAAVFAASVAGAQIPNAPVLQNVWARPGTVAAVNLAGGSGGSLYGLAGAWTPSSGRFQLSAGAGLQSRTASQGAGSGLAYGARVALPLGNATGSFGFGFFAGVGSGTQRLRHIDTTSAALPTVATTTDTTYTNSAVVQAPVGVSVGWRKAIGTTHGVSLYASPSYVFVSGGGNRAGVMRAAVGADVGITQSIGATAGVELGQSRPLGSAGPTGTLWGFGVSYALGGRP